MPVTIGPREIVWVVVGIVGIILHGILAGKNVVDRKIAFKHHAPLPDIHSANVNIRRQIGYALAQLCTVIVGAAAMTIEEPVIRTTASNIIGLVIVTQEVILIINAILDTRDREKLLALVGGRRATDNN
jgi:hypothetical protein